MEIATTTGIAAVVITLVELFKYILGKLVPDKTCKGLEEVKVAINEVKVSLVKNQIHASYGSETQKEILQIIKDVSNTQERMSETLERMTDILDRIDRRHE